MKISYFFVFDKIDIFNMLLLKYSILYTTIYMYVSESMNEKLAFKKFALPCLWVILGKGVSNPEHEQS